MYLKYLTLQSIQSTHIESANSGSNCLHVKFPLLSSNSLSRCDKSQRITYARISSEAENFETIPMGPTIVLRQDFAPLAPKRSLIYISLNFKLAFKNKLL